MEHEQGALEGPSAEALTLARRLAGAAGADLEAVAVGGEADPLAEALARFGASAAYLVRHPLLEAYAPEGWAEALVQLAAGLEPVAVVAPGTDRGTEVLAHAAARMDLPMAANCVEVRPGGPGEPFLVTRQRWGGTLLEEARLEGDPKLLTVALHAVSAEEVPSPRAVELVPFTPELAEGDVRVRASGWVPAGEARGSLAEARVVVGGGRGVGGPEGFALLEELARLLGGVVGCSRAVTSAGWRPHADQIGQTGTRIAPDLYIACGISGATQHLVGCRGAKRILAINTDPEAPIMAHADYAVVGDLHEVVRAVVEEVRKAKEAVPSGETR